MELNCKVTKQVVELLQANNINCYIVGGYVRDSVLGIESKDIDIELHNTTIDQAYEIVSSVTAANIYGSFGVIALENYNTEFAIARTETKVGDLHTDYQVEFITNGDLKLAASRRDFTINSLMYDMQSNQLLDFYGGLTDLENKVLRHVSSAFSEDPLRVLRGIKFITRYNLEMAKETDELCVEVAKQLTYLPTSRIEAELNSIFKNDCQKYGLKLLTKYLYIIFNSLEVEADYGDNKALNQILFFKQFTNYEQVLNFCYENKKTKKDLKFIIDNYQLIKSVEDLKGNDQYELFNMCQYVLDKAIAINTNFGAKYNHYLELKTKYDGKYFLSIGISGKQIATNQKKIIGGKLDELRNSNWKSKL